MLIVVILTDYRRHMHTLTDCDWLTQTRTLGARAHAINLSVACLAVVVGIAWLLPLPVWLCHQIVACRQSSQSSIFFLSIWVYYYYSHRLFAKIFYYLDSFLTYSILRAPPNSVIFFLLFVVLCFFFFFFFFITSSSSFLLSIFFSSLLFHHHLRTDERTNAK